MKLKLEREKAALLVVDVQERLCAAMDRDLLDRFGGYARCSRPPGRVLGWGTRTGREMRQA